MANNQKGANFTKEKLDRVVANPTGMSLFFRSLYNVLPQLKSDHPALFIQITKGDTVVKQK